MKLDDIKAHQQNHDQYCHSINIDEGQDNITIFIEEKLQKIPSFVQECSIFRVPERLLDMNRTIYMPQVISIGPLHYGQEVFKATDELKFQFLNSYVCRICISTQGIVEKVKHWEKGARRYYSEPIDMEKDEFVIVELMIMDLYP